MGRLGERNVVTYTQNLDQVHPSTSHHNFVMTPIPILEEHRIKSEQLRCLPTRKQEFDYSLCKLTISFALPLKRRWRKHSMICPRLYFDLSIPRARGYGRAPQSQVPIDPPEPAYIHSDRGEGAPVVPLRAQRNDTRVLILDSRLQKRRRNPGHGTTHIAIAPSKPSDFGMVISQVACR